MPFHFKKTGFAIMAVAIAAIAIAGNVVHADTANTDTGTAQTEYTLLAPLPCIESSGVTCDTDVSGNQAVTTIDLSQYISYAYKLILALAVFLAVFMITVGGFEYMLGGTAGSKTAALKRIEDAIWGLLLALVAYMILYTIDPNLVPSNTFSIPSISSSAATPAASPSSSPNAQPSLTNNTTPGSTSIPPGGTTP